MEEQGFHFSGGRKAGNVAELREILDSFNQLEFESYVNANKNDFVNWFKNSLGENELASKIEGYYEIEDFKRILDDYLNPSREKDESTKTEEEVEQKKAVKDFDEPVKIDNNDETSDSAKTETEKEEIEDEVKDLIEKNKEITKSIQAEKKNFKPAPKFAGHTLSHPFSKEHIKHLLYGFGFGIIVGAIIVFILMNAGVL